MRLQLPADSPDTPAGRSARSVEILRRLNAKQFDPLVWASFTIASDAHTLTVRTLANGLRMDGVRIVGGSYDCQQFCDVLGLMLPTPKLQDLAYLAMCEQGISVLPSPDPAGSLQTTASWEAHSDRVDALVVAAGGDPLTAFYPYGKIWALDNDAPPGKATNYAWYVGPPPSPTSWGGLSLPQCVTYATSQLRCVQTNRGWIHTIAENECDYSQMFAGFDVNCTFDGQPRLLPDVATSADPTISGLVSHQGPLKFSRLPGVAYAAGGGAAPGADLWLPIGGRRTSQLPTLLNVTPFAGAPPAAVVAWASGFAAAYAPGTIVRDVVGGAAVVARVELDGTVSVYQAA